jgi:uncharacterized integral membrane protein (TIGR00697 family)
MNLVMTAFLYLGRVLPPAPFWGHQAAYEAVLGMVPRIVAASMIAYLVSQFHDVWAFLFWRRVTKGKHLWLRNNLSTMASQLLDSVIFHHPGLRRHGWERSAGKYDCRTVPG